MAESLSNIARLSIPLKFRIISGADRTKKTKFIFGQLTSLTKNELRMNIPSIDIDGLHISFGEPTFIRNTLEIEVDMPGAYWRLRILGEVEWYELIPNGIEYRFHAGVSYKEISEDDRKKLNDFLGLL